MSQVKPRQLVPIKHSLIKSATDFYSVLGMHQYLCLHATKKSICNQIDGSLKSLHINASIDPTVVLQMKFRLDWKEW